MPAPIVPSPYKRMDWHERRKKRPGDQREQIAKLPDYGPDDYKWHELWDDLNDRVDGIATKVNGHAYRVAHSFYIQAWTATRDGKRLDERAGEKADMIRIAEARIAREPTKGNGRRAKRTKAKRGRSERSILNAALRRDGRRGR